MKARLFLASAVLAALLPVAARAAPAVALQPHRAIYTLKLDMVRGQRAVVAVEGRMEYSWAAACDGSTFEQKYQMQMIYASGDQLARNSTYAGWESADGRSLTYKLKSTSNGKDEEISGSATLDGAAGGDAVFKLPAGLDQKLPPGSLFPTTHMQQLVRAMREGKPIFTAGFFDGSSADGPQYVSVAIGRAQSGDPSAGPMLRGPSHAISMAFFNAGETKEQPDYELRQRLFENGVADRIVVDYGDFAMSARLESIEPIEPPRCN